MCRKAQGIEEVTVGSHLLTRFSVVLLLSLEALAGSASSPSTKGSFYAIRRDSFLAAPQHELSGPVELLQQLYQQAEQFINLLDWVYFDEELPPPAERYNRRKHFGTWIDDPTDSDCYDTRAKVLVRDSKVSVTFSPTNQCLVAEGVWDEPYLPTTHTLARDIQIDHLVPLADSYRNGAWRWDQETRCAYANFQGNGYHLLAVDGRANMRKSDKTPEGWMPANLAFSCTYLRYWLSIKMVWGLTMTASEAQAIENHLQARGCDPETMRMPVPELKRLEAVIAKTRQICRQVGTLREGRSLQP
ncbi:MAG: HNH endonuclease family protein [Bdellovibrionaceae bacterium]|nr:HNH endonuclease family protein [Pseudobdellovibrionaceae bacterium]